MGNDGEVLRIDVKALLPVLPEVLGALRRDLRRNPQRAESLIPFLHALFELPESIWVALAPSLRSVLVVLDETLRTNAGLLKSVAEAVPHLPPAAKTHTARVLLRRASAHYAAAGEAGDLAQLVEISHALRQTAEPVDEVLVRMGHEALEEIDTWAIKPAFTGQMCVPVIAHEVPGFLTGRDARWEQLLSADRPRTTYRSGGADGPSLELLVRKKSWLYFRQSPYIRETRATFWLAFFAEPAQALARLTNRQRLVTADELSDTIAAHAQQGWKGLSYASVNLLTLGLTVPALESRLTINTWVDCIERISESYLKRAEEHRPMGWREFAYYPRKVLVNNVLAWALARGEWNLCTRCVELLSCAGMWANARPFLRFVV